jgi:predicted permease
MDFIQTLLLLIAITTLGMFSRRKGLFSSNDKVVLNSFIYRFALPALFIDTISKIHFNQLEIDIIIGSIAPIFLSIALLVVFYLVKIIKKEQMIIASITLAFGSNAFFGIAYFDALYGGEILQYAVFSASLLGMVGVLVSISFLEYAKNGKIELATLLNVFKSPPVFAIFVGIALALFGIHLEFFDKASALLGKTAGGLAIVVLGMFIYDTFSLKLIKEALPYVMLRAALLPVMTFLALFALAPLTETMYAFLLQQSGIPAAISLAIVAQRYEYHEKKIAAIVMLSSLFSFLLLALLYLLSA